MRRSTLLALALAAAAVIAYLLLRDGGSSASDGGDPAAAGGGNGRGASDSPDTRAQRQLPPTSPFGEEFQPSLTATGATVKGRVVDVSSRELVPYVDVAFKQGRAELSANSGPSGEFEIDLFPGTYSVRAIGETVIGSSPAPVVVGRADGVSVEVEVVQLAVVRGKVVYPGDIPAGGATVGPHKHQAGLLDYVKSGVLAATETRSDGTFELRVPPGDVALRASDGVTDGFAQLKDLEPGGELGGVKIVIDPSGAVEGVVYLPDGAPAADAEVLVAVRVPGTSQYDRYDAKTDAAGRFAYDLVRPGRVVVQASAPGYAPTEPVAFDLGSGQRRRGIELTLSDEATISGRVVDANGKPLEDVEVARSWLGSKYKYEKVRTGLDGSFLFTGVGPGPHMVRARKRGYVQVQRRDVMAPAEDIVLQMPFAGGIHGTVTSGGGTPVRRFAVEIRKPKQARGQIKRFFTNNGRYEVFPVDPGRYDVVIRAPDHEEQLVEGVEVETGEYSDVDGSLERR